MDSRISYIALYFLSLNVGFIFREDAQCTIIGDVFLQYKINKPNVEIMDIEVTRTPDNSSVWDVLQKIRPEWKKENLKCFTTSDLEYDDCSDHTFENPVLVKFINDKIKANNLQEETTILRFVHEQGYSPPVLVVFKNGYVMERPVGEKLVDLDSKDRSQYESVATSMALIKQIQLYANFFPTEPKMWETIEGLIAKIPDKYPDELQKRISTELPEGLRTREEIKAQYEGLKKHLLSLNATTAFCHNDVYPPTMYYDKLSKTTTFINYEYAGNNYEAYDIGEYWFEYSGVHKVDLKKIPGIEFMKAFVKKYLEVKRGSQSSAIECTVGTYSDEEFSTLLIHSQKFMLAVDMYWGIYSLEWALHPVTSFDYIKYTSKRFEHFKNEKDRILALKE